MRGCFRRLVVVRRLRLSEWAFTQAPIALVTALCETRIVFALLIGVLVLKERLRLTKVLSTFVTLAGAVLLRVSR